MFKIVALVTFLLTGNVVEQVELTYTQKFGSLEECQTALHTGPVIAAGQALEARTQDIVADSDGAADDAKVEFGCQSDE